MAIDDSRPGVFLPMERPLYTLPVKPVIEETVSLGDGSNIPSDLLYTAFFVDKLKLKGIIRHALQTRDQVTLVQILDAHPLEKGLAELVAYLSLAGDDEKAQFDDTKKHRVFWTDDNGVTRQAEFSAVIFSR
jgi:hypothetical protein